MTAHRPQARRAAPLRCLVTAVLAALLAVTACSGADQDTADAAPRDAQGPADPEHNAADVAFVQAMVARHREAVALAEAAAPRAESAAVRALAERIAASQGPDVATMTGWLDDWGEDAPATDDDGGGDGALSDRAFLTGMIDRHRDAVDLAGAELAEGVHRPARELARAVVTTRTAEIGEMTALLAGD